MGKWRKENSTWAEKKQNCLSRPVVPDLWCLIHCLLCVCKSYEKRTRSFLPLLVKAWRLPTVLWRPSLPLLFGVLASVLIGLSDARLLRAVVTAPMSKLAAFTFHFQSPETVWPEWSYHNVLSCCPVGHRTPAWAHTLPRSALAANASSWHETVFIALHQSVLIAHINKSDGTQDINVAKVSAGIQFLCVSPRAFENGKIGKFPHCGTNKGLCNLKVHGHVYFYWHIFKLLQAENTEHASW